MKYRNNIVTKWFLIKEAIGKKVLLADISK